MNTTASLRLLLLAAPLAFVLSGCDRAADPAPAAQKPAAAATPAGPAAKPGAKPAADRKPAREYPADYAIDARIPKGSISTRVALAGEPAYDAKDGTIEFVVNVSNTGKTAIVGAGKLPVVLTADIVGAPEGGDSLFRRKLPLIPEGTAGRVRVRLPVADIAGKTVLIGLAQGKDVWGERYAQPTLTVGPFAACADATAGYCGADGKPLKAR